jgi:alanine racemase
VTVERPTWAEIDLGAYARNVGVVRSLIGPKVKLFAVGKGDAYGLGSGEIARAAIGAGAYGLATSDPRDAVAIRRAGVTAPLLLYACTTPDRAAEVARLEVIATIHDFESLAAFAALARPVEVFLKLDCGFGRLGFQPDDWPAAFAAARSASSLHVTGLYTHIGHTGDPDLVAEQGRLFQRAGREAEAAGLSDFDLMAASSRVVVGYPDLFFTAVNTGGVLFGVLEEPWCDLVRVEPVLSAVKSRIIQIKDLPPGARIGYDAPIATQAPLRAAVVPFGFSNGYPRFPAGGRVLVAGVSAPIIGSRATEHTVIDVTAIPGAAVGGEVVVLGRQGDREITIAELSDLTGVPMIELVPRLARGSPRVYLR